jgi:hypothetical protein
MEDHLRAIAGQTEELERKAEMAMITEEDRKAFELVKKTGFVRLDFDGLPYLQSYSQISRYRFDRLVKLGLLVPNNDALFEGAQPQTYIIPKEKQNV